MKRIKEWFVDTGYWFTDIWDWILDDLPGVLMALAMVGLVVFIIVLVVGAVVQVPVLNEGLVIDKDYAAEYTTISTIMHTDADGKTYTSSSPVNHPKKCRIKIEGYRDNGDYRIEWWDISGGLYEMINIGDYVARDTKRGTVEVRNVD